MTGVLRVLQLPLVLTLDNKGPNKEQTTRKANKLKIVNKKVCSSIMALSEGLLKLRWNNHEATFCHILHRLRSKPRYSDATLACEGRLFMVHRLVLATCSDFFDEIFQQTPSDTTRAVIVLNEARAQDVECLLDYMYCGQVNVRQANLASLLKTAECLKIKGLAVPEANVSTSNAKRNQEHSPSPDSPPPPKKRRKKKTSSPVTSSTTTTTSDSLIVPSTPLTSSPWHTNSESPNFSSLQASTAPPTIPISSASYTQPLQHTSTSVSQSLPLTVPLKVAVPVTDVEKANQKSGWLQIVSSMRQGSNETQTTPDGSNVSQQQSHQPQKQNLSHSKKNRSLHKSSSMDTHPSQFLQTEIKEEVKEEPLPIPLGPDDPLAEDENSWEDSEQNQESGDRPMYRRIPSLYPPPGLHPVVSGSGLTHTTPVLPLGLFRVGSYAVDLGLNHLVGMNKKGSSPSQATMSPKLMPYAMCSNCGTNNTKLWRRNDKGEIVCNACGLYFKLHGINRPSHLFRTAPMTRRRNPKKKKEAETAIPEQLEQIVSDSSQDKEHIPETDPQDGLAVLNAALTLNSLLAKAKAQQSEALAAQRAAPHFTNKSPSDSVNESRPPPPLLKIPVPVREQEFTAPELPFVGPSREDSPQDPGGTQTPPSQSPHPPPPPSPPPPQPPSSQENDEGRMLISQFLDK
ncbi:protein bric-a-brac 1-like isoform X2 [Homarus americanus]|uniref:protein bric-a-brac 1-like isoform X2 n=1 Tax=Homarus americanus TaxID=6706 RepID=UPI001C479936|nr:protein bric-a-brac 1-like isoform X2 [Homarus americanus]